MQWCTAACRWLLVSPQTGGGQVGCSRRGYKVSPAGEEALPRGLALSPDGSGPRAAAAPQRELDAYRDTHTQRFTNAPGHVLDREVRDGAGVRGGGGGGGGGGGCMCPEKSCIDTQHTQQPVAFDVTLNGSIPVSSWPDISARPESIHLVWPVTGHFYCCPIW